MNDGGQQQPAQDGEHTTATAGVAAAPKHLGDGGRGRATAIGFVAVLLWALLALFTVGAAAVPPFQLTAMAFLVGGLIGVATLKVAGMPIGPALRQPARVWALGVLGLFGYHFFYFTALKGAPPAAAGLVAYLWPLLIVLFSGLLPGGRLGVLHVAGALAGFVGAALLILGGGAGPGFEEAHLPGYAAALLCALIWSGYSVLSRVVGEAPTASVAGFCLAVAVLSGIAHLVLEETVWPDGVLGWAAVLGLGLGPVGAAFYAWDVGCKRGDIQLLGVSAYAAPLLSTLVLVLAGIAEPTSRLALAALLITAGAGVAAWGSARATRT
ncbi:MAG: DMT family transporter [Pseudomonadota bacterium]